MPKPQWVVPEKTKEPTVQLDSDGNADDKSTLRKTTYKFKKCARDAFVLDPSTDGMVKLDVAVATDGAPKVTVLSATTPASLVSCVKGAMGTAKFAARAKAEHVTVKIVVVPPPK